MVDFTSSFVQPQIFAQAGLKVSCPAVTAVVFSMFRTQEVLKEVEAMRQYEEDVDNLNEVAHNRPRAHLVLGRFFL